MFDVCVFRFGRSEASFWSFYGFSWTSFIFKWAWRRRLKWRFLITMPLFPPSRLQCNRAVSEQCEERTWWWSIIPHMLTAMPRCLAPEKCWGSARSNADNIKTEPRRDPSDRGQSYALNPCLRKCKTNWKLLCQLEWAYRAFKILSPLHCRQ